MKVAVVNRPGTVGKTTLAAHLLAPRMPGATIIAVEDVNQTVASLGLEADRIEGDAFREIFRKLMLLDDAIVDVGTSNIRLFLQGMVKFEDSHLEFDYFVVPLTSGTKEQSETITMISTLADFGIPAHKIRLIFNRVNKDVEAEFCYVFQYVSNEKNATANPLSAIYENELFSALGAKKLTIEALLADETDYKGLLKNKEASERERNYWGDMFGLRALAKSVQRNLDSVFIETFV